MDIRFFVASVAIAGSLVVAGCKSSDAGDSSGDGGAGASGSGDAQGGSGADGNGGNAPTGCDDGGSQQPSCSACQEAQMAAGGCCEAPASTCTANEACVALNVCVAECTDDACIEACGTQLPAGKGDFDALLACLLGDGSTEHTGACGAACTATEGSCTDGGTDHPNCETCKNVEFAAGGCCAVQASTCVANDDCTALNDCIFACAASDDACLNGCVETWPDGAADLTALLDCAYGDGDADLGACASACLPTCGDGGVEFLSCNDCQAAEASAGGCCAAPADVCTANQACAALVDCLNACASGDDDCGNACLEANPGGADDLSALMNCLLGDGQVVGACSTACS